MKKNMLMGKKKPPEEASLQSVSLLQIELVLIINDYPKQRVWVAALNFHQCKSLLTLFLIDQAFPQFSSFLLFMI